MPAWCGPVPFCHVVCGLVWRRRAASAVCLRLCGAALQQSLLIHLQIEAAYTATATHCDSAV